MSVGLAGSGLHLRYGGRDENIGGSELSFLLFIVLGAKRCGDDDWGRWEDGWIIVMITTRFTPFEIETGEL